MVAPKNQDWMKERVLNPPLYFKPRRKTKLIKSLATKQICVLGQDVYMDKVKALCSRALVGRLEYCKMNKDAYVEWATQH